MRYQLVTVPAARRALKKLPRDVRKHLVEAMQVLVTQPYTGKRLEDRWRFLHAVHTVYRRTHYRIVYQVDESQKQIIIRFAASRENFYRKLQKVKLKPLG